MSAASTIYTIRDWLLRTGISWWGLDPVRMISQRCHDAWPMPKTNSRRVALRGVHGWFRLTESGSCCACDFFSVGVKQLQCSGSGWPETGSAPRRGNNGLNQFKPVWITKIKISDGTEGLFESHWHNVRVRPSLSLLELWTESENGNTDFFLCWPSSNETGYCQNLPEQCVGKILSAHGGRALAI